MSTDAALPETDWQSVGLVLAGLGAGLLGLALLVRGQRALVRELLGTRGARSVRVGDLREAIFQRAQLVVGLAWMALGFVLQLLGRFRPVERPAFPVAWAGAIVIATLGLLGIAWVLATRAARRAVREELLADGRDLGADMALARELGELFGVESRAEDSVETYLERLHAEIGLERGPRDARRRSETATFEFDEHDEPR